jgi:outer membrane protein assembly factor BamA
VKFVTADYNPATGRADVTFHVDAGPKVQLHITGGHVWFWKKKSLIPIYTENTIDEETIQEGRQNLLGYFQGKGFYDAAVQSNVSRNPNTTIITYAITKNQKHKVESVAVKGNTAFSDSDLLNHSDVQKSRRFLSRGKYSEQLVRRSVSNLKAVYLNAGYSQVKVTPQVTRDHGNVLATYVVEEGERDYVSELKIVGNDTVPVSQLAPKGLKLGPNQPYSPQLEQQDRNAITAQYLLNGYLTASVTSKARPTPGPPHHVTVTYTIHEGPKVSTAKLIIVGKQKTRSELITKSANIKVGQPLSEAELLTSESKLYTLGIFDWAEVDPKRAITEQNSEDVLIKVHESKRNSITYGFGFEVINRGGSLPSGTVSVPGIPPVGLPQGFRTSQTTYYGPRGTFEYTRRNLRGTAESYTIGGFAGRLDQRVSATYNDPAFRNSSWNSSYLVSFEHDSQNPVFTSRIGTSGLQFQKYVNAKKTDTVFLRYNFQYTDLSGIFPGLEFLVPTADRRVRLSTLSASFVRDTRDNVLDAHKGLYESIELGITPTALGSSANFGRFVGQISHYGNIGHGIIWANNFRLGLEQPFAGSHVPISEEFFTGGGSTLRGFPLNGAGPQQYTTVCGNAADPSTCGPITVPIGGNQLILVNSEFRIPLDVVKKGLGIVPFYDGGNVYQHVGFKDFTTNCNAASKATTGTTTGGTSITTVTPSCFTSSVGIGLRYSTPIGPVRIDIGHNLNNITGIKSTQLFITLGQAF